MRADSGIIFIDKSELFIYLFEVNKKSGKIEILKTFNYNFDNSKQNSTISTEILEFLAHTLTLNEASGVYNWKIYSRNISIDISKDLSKATGIDAEHISLSREQDLICKGLLSEFV